MPVAGRPECDAAAGRPAADKLGEPGSLKGSLSLSESLDTVLASREAAPLLGWAVTARVRRERWSEFPVG